MADVGRVERFAAALVTGHTIAQAAEAAGVSERTAYRLLASPETRDLVERMRARTIEHAVERLIALTDDACDTLANVMHDAEAAPTARVSAARVVLSSLLPMREAIEVEARLREVEEALARRPRAVR